jgi:UDP-2,3-diacylglucosamine hydrolase
VTGRRKALPADAPRIAKVDARSPVFLSDTHLTTQRPGTVARVLGLLEALAQRPEGPGELFVLGDFFEYWAGDDALGAALPDDLLGARLADALGALSRAGWRVLLMHGNRDILLGEAFLQRAGAALLADPAILQTPDGPVLLSHGDAWCTLDAPYQAFRAQAREPGFQASFLALPLAVRRARIGQARAKSEANKKVMDEAIMDVTQDAIEGALRQAGVTRVIHGHTHRPARHDFLLDGVKATRWVLPDWHDEAGEKVRGGAMKWVNGELVALS